MSEAVSAWAPLRVAAFRSLWIALLASNIGTWMQLVGAQWLLIDEPNASTLVAVVQTSLMLPALLLSLPAGAVADSFDRRQLLIVVQAYLLIVAVVMTGLTAVGEMPPALLLTLTFGLGVGQALTLPAWQALVPELVPRDQLPAASALGGISVNAARAIGPAIAGLLISHVGVAAVFGFNGAACLVFALVLALWKPDRKRRDQAPERFTSALRAGDRYARHSPVVRRILLRASLFLVPGTTLWALLPLVANKQLGMGSSGYGLLLAALGIGAIGGALVTSWARARWRGNLLLMVTTLGYAACMAVVGLSRSPVVVLLVLLPAGAIWTAVLSSLNAEIQMFLPSWVRARGIAVYQVVFAGSQALGALAWGLVADVVDLPVTHLVAAGLMVVGGLTVRLWPLRDVRGLGREPAVYWQEPELVVEPAAHDGPILVTVKYLVLPKFQEAFQIAMDNVRLARLRTGATRWGLFRSGEEKDTFVEVYLIPTWDVHLRQHHGRLTENDRLNEERAHSLIEGDPQVTHLLPTDAD
ncbi:MFS transporter [Virgisporangium ochraceum]|uniref:MFS transporter n=1 Tax=Virgisporangium ochraceum TaxID=65505 RepID=A0A8J3ZX15_9ACTN|nr:MFS transporter [Virgisporangium ochraceum]GIJ71929.1 MFS transporter [Virgisporangium ochraceum]